MKTPRISLYLHAHQPYRVRPMTLFDVAKGVDYFAGENGPGVNEEVLAKVCRKSYVPALNLILELLDELPEFCMSLSITGTLVEQLEGQPETLELFQKVGSSDRVEILAETYYHSLAFLRDIDEHEAQVLKHSQMVKDLFGKTPTAFRGTELLYSNQIAEWAQNQGYETVISEGLDDVLKGRSTNKLYSAVNGMPVSLKNHKLSDDIAFRYSDTNWSEWPLTPDKFCSWIDKLPEDDDVVNLFMDFETFGEHQWDDRGIFKFLDSMPRIFSGKMNGKFLTVSQAAQELHTVGEFDCPEVRTWADEDRDLSAWIGNDMQKQAIEYIYLITNRVLAAADADITEDWRRLQISDSFYYMCTKWFADGDVHAYFSPYDSPYDAFIYYMNALRDMEFRLMKVESKNV